MKPFNFKEYYKTMKTFRLMMVGAVLTGLFAVSASAQAAAANIAVINTLAFGADQGGITKYVNAQKRLDDEFKVENQQLTDIAKRINTLKEEIQKLSAAVNPNVPVSTKSVNDKIAEHDNLTREYKFKQENAKAKYESRSEVVLGPVSEDIFNAMQVFAKQKGFAMILDAAKLDRAGLILAFDAKFDVTKEFITFYNARPAGSANATN